MNLIRRDKFVALIFLSNQIAYLREYLNTGNPEHKSNAVYHGVWLLCEVVDEDTFYKFANIDFQNASEETLKDLIEIKKIILQRVQEDPPALEDLEGGDLIPSFEEFKKTNQVPTKI